MTQDELYLLQSAMDCSSNYLEFGTGNSTFMAVSTPALRKITVVESDASFWKMYILSEPTIQEAIANRRLNPLLIDIGPVKEWGYPVDDTYCDKWPAYHNKAFVANEPYDLVLVDGRFRIACTLHCCLCCSSNTKILIHDFFNRPFYFTVLPFLQLEEHADTLALFTIKEKVYPEIIEQYISIYENFPEF